MVCKCFEVAFCILCSLLLFLRRGFLFCSGIFLWGSLLWGSLRGWGGPLPGGRELEGFLDLDDLAGCDGLLQGNVDSGSSDVRETILKLKVKK